MTFMLKKGNSNVTFKSGTCNIDINYFYMWNKFFHNVLIENRILAFLDVSRRRHKQTGSYSIIIYLQNRYLAN